MLMYSAGLRKSELLQMKPKAIDSERILPVLIGLNAYEVYRQLFNKDPQICSKCKKGKLIPIPIKSKSPS